MLSIKKWHAAITICLTLLLAGAVSQSIFAQNAQFTSEVTGDKTSEYYTGDIAIAFEVTDAAKTKQVVLAKESSGSGIIENNEEEFPVTEESPDTQSGSFTVSKTWLAANEPDGNNYTLYIVATDKNNEKSSKAVTFKANASEPEADISGAEEGKSYNSAKTITFIAVDGNLSNDTIAMSVKRNGTVIAQASNKAQLDENKNVECSEDGVYEASISLKDPVGRTAEKTLHFIIDKNGPVITDEAVTGDLRDGYTWFYQNVKVAAKAAKNVAALSEVTVTINDQQVFRNASQKDAVNISQAITNDWLQEHPAKAYVVVITAKDEAGNVTTKELSFKADVIVPTLFMEGVEDGAIINEAPSIVIAASDFNKDEDGFSMTTTVKRNGETIATDTVKNTYTFTPSQDGHYEIESSATDVAGNVSEALVFTFDYDTVAPKVNQLNATGPKRTNYDWFYSYVDLLAKTTDDFTGLALVEIKVNKETVAKAQPEGALTNDLPHNLDKTWFEKNESGNGKYIATVTVKDRAGNESSSDISFYADVITPSVKLSGISNGTHTNRTPSVNAEVSDNYPSKNITYYEIFLDGKKLKTVHKEGKNTSCDAFKSDGDYIVRVRSIDRAGNESPVKTVSFTKDTIAPKVNLSGARQGSFNRGTVGLKATVKERNYKTVTVKTTLSKKLDGKKSTLSFPVRPNKQNYQTTKRLHDTGTYEATIYAVDKAGNRSAVKKLSFTVDNTKPKLKITGVHRENGYDAIVAPKIVFSDSYYDSRQISLTKTGDKKPEGITFKDSKTKDGGSRVYADFMRSKGNDGIYTLSCSVKDKAGNVASEKVTFKINRFGSRYIVPAASRELNGSYNKELLDDIVIRELNVTGLKTQNASVVKDGAPITDPAVKQTKKQLDDGTMRYSCRIDHTNFTEEGAYSINLTSEDTVGNFSEYTNEGRSFKLFIDKTPPTISVTGVEEGGTYSEGEGLATVNVTDNIALSEYRVFFGNESVGTFSASSEASAPISLPDGVNKTLSVSAEDKAGNVSTYEVKNVTVSSSAFTRLLSNKPLALGLLGGIPLAAALAAAALVLIRRKGSQPPAV